jgi:hypothetical protein
VFCIIYYANDDNSFDGINLPYFEFFTVFIIVSTNLFFIIFVASSAILLVLLINLYEVFTVKIHGPRSNYSYPAFSDFAKQNIPKKTEHTQIPHTPQMDFDEMTEEEWEELNALNGGKKVKVLSSKKSLRRKTKKRNNKIKTNKRKTKSK